jgi:hypothetical protein
MLLGSDPESTVAKLASECGGTAEKHRDGPVGLAVLALGLVAVAILGLYLGPLQRLLDAATIVAGGR